MSAFLDHLQDELRRIPNYVVHGQVASIQGMLVELNGMQSYLSIGDRCNIMGRKDSVTCEVIGFRDGRALAMPYAGLQGIGQGSRVEMQPVQPVVHPHASWLGRVINGFGRPIDGKGVLAQGDHAIPVRNTPPPAHTRRRVGSKIDLGVRVLNSFTSCCRGQRMGIFAGSGVGKSVMMGMLSRYSDAEVIVIGLVGERGREVQEFLQEDLGEEGLKRSVVVIATSDESALMRRDAAYVTLSVAEYFRDQGKDVLLLMDSVTRFAMAQREIGLSVGEPPATRGYTPSVFAELPRLLERAGPGIDHGPNQGADQGGITALFTVLVEGDDHNEPVADAVRGILDGHIVLERKIAERNRYPAVNVLRSVSRTMPACNNEAEIAVITKARRLLSTYEDMAELIRLGAYRSGSDPAVDEAIRYQEPLEQFMSQRKNEKGSLDSDFRQLAEVLDLSYDDLLNGGSAETAKSATSQEGASPNNAKNDAQAATGKAGPGKGPPRKPGAKPGTKAGAKPGAAKPGAKAPGAKAGAKSPAKPLGRTKAAAGKLPATPVKPG